MHFHLPKPLHGWREFVGEVGIIVIGVLIALSFEQVAERIHWRHAVSEAERSMTEELTEDDGPQGFQRLAFSRCIDGQLDSLQQALVAERDSGAPLRPLALSVPHFFTWDSNSFRQATASGALDHMSTRRAFDWSGPFALSDGMNALQVREQADYGDLKMIEAAPPHPSDTMRTQLLAAIAKARMDNVLLTQLVHAYFRYVGVLGVRFSKDEQRRYVRRDSYLFPQCAVLFLSGTNTSA